MPGMFHINNSNEAKSCRAKTPEACRYYRGEEDTRHYDNINDAVAASTKLLEGEYGLLRKQSKYSLLKDFQKKTKEFEGEYSEVSNRFFNYDLRGKYINPGADILSQDFIKNFSDWKAKQVSHRMVLGLTTPKDMKLSEEQLKNYGEALNIENLHEAGPHDLKSLNAAHSLIGEYRGKTIVLVTPQDKPRFDDFSTYSLRRRNGGELGDNYFITMSGRAVKGSKLLSELTGNKSQFDVSIGVNPEGLTQEERLIYKRIITIDSLDKLELRQDTAKAFKNQQRFFKENISKSATVFMDKKNQSDLNKALAKDSLLNNDFSHIEIDDDVSPIEFKDFEKSFMEVRDKLPKVPEGLKPELRLRKLGRHNAIGLYSASKNAIAVDVRDSSSLIHEYGHYIDLTIKENASISEEFSKIRGKYIKSMKFPDDMSEDKKEYYNTPTEVLARGYEVYTSVELGINNRLNDPTRQENFDYKPFIENKELQEELFSFFRKNFK